MNRFKDKQIAMIITGPYQVEIRFKDMTSYLELTSRGEIYYYGSDIKQLTNRPCGDIILEKKGDMTELRLNVHSFMCPRELKLKVIEEIN